MFKLSITGADNLVLPKTLKSMVEKYPHLELAILYFPEKENHNRNPGLLWRNEFFSMIPKENTAIHLCGKEVFDIILNENFELSTLFIELKKTQRIQININARKDIFSITDIQRIYTILLSYGFTLILQYHERSKEWILPYINETPIENVHILLDSSLGKGVAPEKFILPEELQKLSYPIGFAGGLNPDNIDLIYKQIKLFNLSDYWLDLESGCRTNDNFDINKAEQLCATVFKY